MSAHACRVTQTQPHSRWTRHRQRRSDAKRHQKHAIGGIKQKRAASKNIVCCKCVCVCACLCKRTFPRALVGEQLEHLCVVVVLGRLQKLRVAPHDDHTTTTTTPPATPKRGQSVCGHDRCFVRCGQNLESDPPRWKFEPLGFQLLRNNKGDDTTHPPSPPSVHKAPGFCVLVVHSVSVQLAAA
jgi:hypothetical protein